VKIQQAIDTLHEEYKQRNFLVGDQFSRADLSAAALLAPLIMPQGYGLDWPESMPEKLQAFVDKNETKLARFRQLYSEFR
jgi:glutathione S-transferase